MASVTDDISALQADYAAEQQETASREADLASQVASLGAQVAGLTSQVSSLTAQLAASEPRVTATLAASPADLPDGPGSVTLTWTSQGADSVSIDNGVGGVAPIGSTVVPVDGPTTFTITATRQAETASSSASVTVEVPAPPPPPVATVLPAPPAVDLNGHAITYSTPTRDQTIPNAVATKGRAAVLTMESTGDSFVFNESAGKNMGDYVGPFVQQHCTMVQRSDCGFTVFFRPDVSGGREEGVVELGKLFGAANAACMNVGPYTATFYKDGVQVAQVQVPYHSWFSRWRWQSAPRPLVRTTAQVQAFFPGFAKQVTNKPVTSDPLTYRFPMDNAVPASRVANLAWTNFGTAWGMGAPGDRNELGLVTEEQADYTVNGTPAALQALFARAETSASVPYHQRDENTGAPVNFIQYPLLHWNRIRAGVTGEIQVQIVRTGAPTSEVASMWGIEDSHMPQFSTVAYLYTDDPFWLEEMQFQANYHIGWTLYHRYVDGKINGVPQPVINPSETRGFAWGVNIWVHVAKSSPASPPSWLLGQSYTTQVLGINSAYFTRVLTNPVPPPAGWTDNAYAGPWKVAVNPNCFSGFMVDYLCGAMSVAVINGFADWTTPLAFSSWLIKQLAIDPNWRQWFVPYEIWAIAHTVTVGVKAALQAGSVAISGLSSTLGLVSGMKVTGVGVAANTTLVGGGGTWSLSQPALASGTAVALTISGIVQPDFAGVTVADMKGLFNNFCLNNNIDTTKFPADGSWAQNKIVGQSPGYTGQRKAVFSILSQLGDPDAPTCLANVGAMADSVMSTPSVGGYPWRWSFRAA